MTDTMESKGRDKRLMKLSDAELEARTIALRQKWDDLRAHHQEAEDKIRDAYLGCADELVRGRGWSVRRVATQLLGIAANNLTPQLHRWQKDRGIKWSDSKRVELTDSEIDRIKQLYSWGEPKTSLAKIYSVAPATIRKHVNGVKVLPPDQRPNGRGVMPPATKPRRSA